MAISGVRLHPTDKNVAYSFSNIENTMKKIVLADDQTEFERTAQLWE